MNKTWSPPFYSEIARSRCIHCNGFVTGYLDSNQEMTESESVALPFGDSPISYNKMYYKGCLKKMQVFF